MQDDLGAGIRRVREERQLSLRSVASALGISPSLLSQVETGKTQPSVSTLYALVNHLQISLDELLGTSSAAPSQQDRRAEAARGFANNVVQRAEDNPIIEMENGVTWERLAVSPSDLVDPLITTYAPGGSSSVDGRLMRHSGIEHAYLLAGELTLQLDFDTYVIRAGDSLCFESTRPHLYINRTKAPARGIWFVIGRREISTDYGKREPTTQYIGSAVDAMEAFGSVSRFGAR